MKTETVPLTNAQIRKLKGLAQRMEPSLHLGKQGLSPGFLQMVRDELARHELVKIRFGEFKEQRKELAPELATRTEAVLVTLIGNVVVLFRRNPESAQQKIVF